MAYSVSQKPLDRKSSCYSVGGGLLNQHSSKIQQEHQQYHHHYNHAAADQRQWTSGELKNSAENCINYK